MKAANTQKRNQFILIALLTIGAVAGLWMVVIRAQQQNLRDLAADRATATQKLQQAKRAIEMTDQVEGQFCEAKKRLDKIEETMATGDLYSWAINTIRQFKLSYKVEIPQFSQVDGPKEMTMLAKFPYKQATWTIAGTAQFHDFGKFLADFENQFPYARVLNLGLEPVSGPATADKERLSFRLEIVALVKPGVS